MQSRTGKSILAAVLSGCMIASCMPLTSMAAETFPPRSLPESHKEMPSVIAAGFPVGAVRSFLIIEQERCSHHADRFAPSGPNPPPFPFPVVLPATEQKRYAP